MQVQDTFRELQIAHFAQDWRKIWDEARRKGQSSDFYCEVMRATDSF